MRKGLNDSITRLAYYSRPEIILKNRVQGVCPNRAFAPNPEIGGNALNGANALLGETPFFNLLLSIFNRKSKKLNTRKLINYEIFVIEKVLFCFILKFITAPRFLS